MMFQAEENARQASGSAAGAAGSSRAMTGPELERVSDKLGEALDRMSKMPILKEVLGPVPDESD